MNERFKIDRNKIWIDQLSKKYPLVMKGILELKPIDDESNVNWVVIKRPTGTYIGQANYSTREGRGGYHFKEDGSTWIGYWEDNDKSKYGKLYGKDGKLIWKRYFVFFNRREVRRRVQRRKKRRKRNLLLG